MLGHSHMCWAKALRILAGDAPRRRHDRLCSRTILHRVRVFPVGTTVTLGSDPVEETKKKCRSFTHLNVDTPLSSWGSPVVSPCAFEARYYPVHTTTSDAPRQKRQTGTVLVTPETIIISPCAVKQTCYF